LRRQVLLQARRLLPPGDLFIHSEWQFQHSPRLLQRVQPWERIGLSAAEVDEGDTLLDWRYALPDQVEAVGLRYVHLYSLAELDALARECGFEVRETFESDGQGGRLGLYQVWQAV
jgi:tRNA (uracil-5-)-methyltransferase TRM9